MKLDSRVKVWCPYGPCLLDIDEVARQWNSNTLISRYHDEWCMAEYIGLDSEDKIFRVAIHKEQAKEIIKRLSLVEHPSPIFNASTWRKLDR